MTPGEAKRRRGLSAYHERAKAFASAGPELFPVGTRVGYRTGWARGVVVGHTSMKVSVVLDGHDWASQVYAIDLKRERP